MTTEAKTIIVVTIVCLAILFGGAWFYQKSIPKDVLTDNREALIHDSSKRQTATSSKVTVVEFGDYQCPACGYVEPGVEELKQTYKDKVTFVFRDYPLGMHPNAVPAAKMSYIADEQGKYWEMHDKLYATQTQWEDLSDPSDMFIGYAKELGLNTDGMKEKLASDIYMDRIKSDIADGDKLGVNSTPTFFVNDTIIRVADYKALKKAIDDELAK